MESAVLGEECVEMSVVVALSCFEDRFKNGLRLKKEVFGARERFFEGLLQESRVEILEECTVVKAFVEDEMLLGVGMDAERSLEIACRALERFGLSSRGEIAYQLEVLGDRITA